MTRPFSLNEVRIGGTIATEPVSRMREDQTVVELRLDVPDIENGRQRLPLVVAIWPDSDSVGLPPKVGRVAVVTGTLERTFYRSGAGTRSVTEVRAKKMTVTPGEAD